MEAGAGSAVKQATGRPRCAQPYLSAWRMREMDDALHERMLA